MLGFGARLRELGPDLGRDLLEGPHHLGLDIGDTDDHGAEASGDRGADSVLLKARKPRLRPPGPASRLW